MRTKMSLSVIAGLVLFAFCLTEAASAADLKIRFTDRSRLKFVGDWAHISYQAYTSKSVGSGKRKGTMTCTPNLSGTYQIIAEFKATVNRGNRALYYVDGKLAKEVDQHTSSGSTFPKVSLGVFALTPESTVELRAQDGKSYSFVSFTFSKSTEKPGSGTEQQPPTTAGGGAAGGSLDDVLGTGKGGNDETFTAKKDGDMTIEPYLSTYQAAEFRVLVDGKEVLAWVRTSDTSRDLCVVEGKADENSMIEKKPGDFSPAPGLKYTIAVKAGQKVTAVKKGSYEAGSQLKITGPF